MIGICGGFTTFSSFSLQTLDLARDGKPSAALANIALSVILCLLAVTAGYASAEVINRGAPQAEALGVKANGGVVLAVLDRPGNAASVLSNAARLLSFWGGKPTLEALAVRTPPVAELMEADQAITHAQEASASSLGGGVGARGDVHDAALGGASAAAPCQPNSSKPKAISLILLAELGRISSAVVLGSAREPGKTRDALHAALFDTSRPVLIAPPESRGEFGRVVAVAWKDDARAPKAVLDALPILAKAEAVHVLRARVDRSHRSGAVSRARHPGTGPRRAGP